MTIVVNPKYQHISDYIGSIPEAFDNIGESIYDERNTIRRMSAPDGTQLCVKRFLIPRWFNRIAYSFFRKPKAMRAYENALRIIRLGIPTPTPIAYIICTENKLITYSYLITEFCTYPHTMREFDNGIAKGKEPVLQAFAKFTATLHDKRILHRDYSPGNILFDTSNGKTYFSIIDINRMSFCQIGQKEGCRNFRRMWGTPDVMRFIATEYAKARHFDEKECVKQTLDYWRGFWKHRDHHFDLQSNN